MAFGGRELRLFLSIESYGVTNIRNLRRDIAGLSAATDAANRRQAQLLARQQRELKSVNTLQQRQTALTMQQASLASKRKGIQSAIAGADARQLRAQMQFAKAANVASMKGLVQAASRKNLMLQETAYFKKLNPMAQYWALQWHAGTLAMQKAEMQMAAMPAEAAALDAKLKQVNADLARMQATAAATGRELAFMQAETIPLAARIDRAMNAERIARQAAHIGRAMQFAGLLISAGFGMAAASFASFSNEASTAATQMRDIGAPIAQTVQRTQMLSDEILKLMMRFPATADEMSKAAYDIFSSMNIVHNGVVDVKKGFDLLATANKLAVAGNVDLAEATDVMITVLNNFDPQLRNVGRTMNEVFAIVRFGRMRLNDFGAAMQKLAPIAKTSGISLVDLGGAFATLSLMFPDVQNAAAGLGRAMELFRLPQVQKGLEGWGVQITDSRGRLKSLYDIIGLLIKRFPELATGQKSAVEVLMQITKLSGMTKVGIQGTIQARRAIAALASNYGLYGDVLKNVTKNKGEFDAAFAARIKDPGVQWQVFLNTMRALVIMIGKEALPIFLSLGKHIARFVQWFRELNPTIRTVIVQFGVAVGLLGLFGGTLINAVSSVAALRWNLRLMALTAEETTGRFAAMRYIIGTLGVMGLGVLLTQVVGLQRAVIIMAAAWIFWRTTAVQAVVQVVRTNQLGALKVAAAWRSALIATGWGAVVVASALAVEQIMAHWDELQAYFQAWREDWKGGFARFWSDTVNSFKNWGGTIAQVIGKVIGSSDLEEWGRNMQDEADKALRSLGKGNSKFDQAYSRYLKNRRKKGKDAYQQWLNDLNSITNKFVTKDFLDQQEKFADSIMGGDDAATKAKERARIIQQAQEDMAQKVGSAVDNMIQTYERFKQQNQAALGTLFQGPVMSGIFGQIFGNINNVLRQFGEQIPIPFNILKQDLDMSVEYFRRWRTDINKLIARGAPPEFIRQIQALGPEAGIPIAEGLLAGGEKGWKDLLAEWKKGQKLLDKATTGDMDRQLKEWMSYGKKIAWEIINGISSDPAQAKLREGYKTWITDVFGEVLNSEMQAQVTQALADAAEITAAAGIPSTGGAGGKGKPPATAGATRVARQREIQTINRQQAAIMRNITALKKGPPIPGQQQQIRAARSRWATLEGREQILRAGQQIARTQQRINTLNAEQTRIQNLFARWKKSGKDPNPNQRAQLIQQAFRLGQSRVEEAQARKVLRQQQARQTERMSIQAQLRAGRERGERRIQVTYHGDTVTVNASGATPASVMRALDKAAFRKKNKKKTHG